MTKKQKRQLYRILGAVGLLLVAFVYRLGWEADDRVVALIELAAYIAVGGSVLLSAASNMRRGQVFDESFLMSIATFGAICLGDYLEGVAVMLFYQIGDLFESMAIHQSRKSIAALMNIRPDHANVMENGQWTATDPESVQPGTLLLIKPGERVPLDGTVIEGSSSLDTSAITGESMPRDVSAGSEIYSGCVNLHGVLTVRTDKAFGQSTVARILDLVENAGAKKAEMERFITRFARYYTPAVVAFAAGLAILPPLILPGASFRSWIYRAFTFLVISCPCALVISVPLSFFGGLGGASRKGILVKGGNYLEALARAQIVVFDKTGTLTKGSFKVTEVVEAAAQREDNLKEDGQREYGQAQAELLELAALAESHSTHPIALSLREAYGQDADPARIGKVSEIPGYGIEAEIDGEVVYVGNRRLMEERAKVTLPDDPPGAVVHAAKAGQYLGYIRISDQIKETALEAVTGLKAMGVKETVMLTGDAEHAGKAIAGQLRIDQVYAQLLPADKVDKVEALMAVKSAKGTLVFVGDGINDAPTLARADVGVAMGALGSDAAIEAADVVIMDDDPARLITAMRTARKTVRIAKQNTYASLCVKGVVLALGALGYAGMWAAVFADVGVMIAAVMNAIRALRD